MCTVHHYHMCTDVYLQGSWVGNEKIMGSCLPADVKAVARAFSCAAFTQERARWRTVTPVFSSFILPCHVYLFFFLVEEAFSGYVT